MRRRESDDFNGCLSPENGKLVLEGLDLPGNFLSERIDVGLERRDAGYDSAKEIEGLNGVWLGQHGRLEMVDERGQRERCE